MPYHYIVDGNGAVQSNNQKLGRKLSSIATLLELEDRHLRSRLELAIRAAISDQESTALVCPSESQPLGTLVTVRPAREAELAVVTVSDLDTPPASLRPSQLVEMFSITRAEAAIAIALYRGEELTEIAIDRDVSLETVRGQVKSLLRKLGVTNQRRLTALLYRIALALPSPAYPPAGGLQPTSQNL